MTMLEMRFCSDCQQVTEIHVSSPDAVCTECGLVVEINPIDDTQDVRIFEDNKYAQRIEQHHDPFALCKPDLAPTAISGNSGKNAAQLIRTQKKQKSTQKENNTAEHLKIMTTMSELLNVSKPVLQRAVHIYNDFVENGPSKRYSEPKIRAILASALYHAGKQLGQAKTLLEWVNSTGLSQHQIFEAGNLLKPHIEKDVQASPDPTDLDIPDLWSDDNLVNQACQGLKAFVIKLCNALRFEFRQRKFAEEMAVEVVKRLSMRRKPASTAAAIVWICSLLFERKDDINVIVRHTVSKKVITAAFKELFPDLEMIVPRTMFGPASEWKKKLHIP